MSIKPLGVVREVVESAGMGVSYAYDDLVFINHNGFLLQFTDTENELVIHINDEADEEALQNDIARLTREASTRDMSLMRGRYYRLHQDSEENIRLEFTDAREY